MRETWRFDARLALRGLMRAPGFTLAVVLTLALGLGANATIFTVLDRVLLSPPEHVVNADEVRRINVHGRSPFTGDVSYSGALSYPDYADLQGVHGFAGVAGYGARSLTLGQGEESERVSVEWSTASYFPLLGVKAASGRFYTEEEDRVGAAEPLVVLSWRFWERRFGRDRSVLGRRLAIGKGTYTVIGVAPRGFTGVDLSPVDLWLPLHVAGTIEQGIDWANARQWYWLSAIVRMDPDVAEGTTLAQATTRYQTGRAAVRNQDRNAKVVATPLIAARGPNVSGQAQVTQLLGLVSLLVLLIACANVANLFLARGLQRRRSLAVQSALGVSRGRLVMHVLAEAILLSTAAGILAVVLAQGVHPALFRILLPEYSVPEVTALRVAVLTAGLALLTVLLAGLVPALRAARVDPFDALRTARSSPRSSWLRSALLATQATLSIILLVGAGLFVRSLREANQLALGLDLDPLVLDIELRDGTRSGPQLGLAAQAVLERLRSQPMVASATLTSLAPFQGVWGAVVDLPGPDSVPDTGNGPFFYAAGPDYFRTLGMRIMRGRGFVEADENPSAQLVAVVNQAMARHLWNSEQEAVGQCLLIQTEAEGTPPCTTVVGVVNDVMSYVTATEPTLYYYVPTRHPVLDLGGRGTVIVRLKAGADQNLAQLTRLARDASPDIRYIGVQPIRSSIHRQLRAWQMGAVLLSVFGILALIVAGSGLYSVLSFDVTQRRFELGLRAALGATPRRLIRAVTARALAVTFTGVGFGLLGAIALGRLVESLLFRVQPVDPLTYTAAILVLGLCAVIAAALPAWRATRVDLRIWTD
jgi:predicted permease